MEERRKEAHTHDKEREGGGGEVEDREGRATTKENKLDWSGSPHRNEDYCVINKNDKKRRERPCVGCAKPSGFSVPARRSTDFCAIDAF